MPVCPVAAIVLAALVLRAKPRARRRRSSSPSRGADVGGAIAALAISSVLVVGVAFATHRVWLRSKSTASTRPDAATWSPYVSPQGDFSAEFPRPPEVQQVPGDGVHTLRFVTSIARGPELGAGVHAFSVVVGELPEGTQVDMDEREAEFVRRSHATVTSSRAVAWGSATGRELRGAALGKAYAVRLFRVERRWYELVAMHEAGDPRPDLDERFFSSVVPRAPAD